MVLFQLIRKIFDDFGWRSAAVTFRVLANMNKSVLYGRFFLAMSILLLPVPSQAGEWRVGFGKSEVTPVESVRLSGYSSRTETHEGVADALFARAMALSPLAPSSDSESAILVSVDSILVTSALTVEVAEWLYNEYGIPRSRLAISSTHSHAAPHVSGGLENLFGVRSTEQQAQATARNTRRIVGAIKTAVIAAMNTRQAAKVDIGDSQAGFAVNRRLLKDGIWSGFGVQPDGQVDLRLRVFRVRDKQDRILGGSFQYACHCTTLGGDFNQVSGDWAGLAASRLEVIHSEAVFLPIIGCGADANPNPRGTYDMAQTHAAEIVDGVQQVLRSNELQPLDVFPTANFGYAGLVPEQPTSETIEEMASSQRSNERWWAEHMTRVREEMGRLPETYPMPIHTWQFGDQLTWVFLGGEVVVDYQFQIEKEMPTAQTWVAAYTDDVFAYVASEQMRSEGGYEVDFSMIFYLQPGRWQSGTQSLILRRVSEILNGELTETEPLSAEDALASMRVPEGYRVELVASEPLVSDPINVAFGSDGRVWVVEMADYPLGVQGGGRIKWLRDTNHDGQLDQAQLFLEGLAYPSSVAAWEDGAIVIAAPDIFFAADRDGDGLAEYREVLLTGIDEANPQHRASGFEIGLDGWLHFSAGDGTEVLKSSRNGKSYEVKRKDVAWNPNTGEIRTTSGQTQFVRARDAFGNWFGNSNSNPIYQYVIEDRYLGGRSVYGGIRQDLTNPPVAPPVLPRSKTIDRFNDLFALNRFTSACSSIISRVPGVTDEGGSLMVGFVCEPVHNLVSRIQINGDGATLSAERHADDDEFEFFTSTDPWSRPVRAVNAPDGSIWIVDMVRRVIEHPEWIPTSWQERLDLRAGSQLGRIYRVYRDDFQPLQLPDWTSDSASELLPALASRNGAVRDLALQRIMQADSLMIQKDVERMAREHAVPGVRASALGCLAAKGWLQESDVAAALADPDRRVVRYALELSESFQSPGNALAEAIAAIPAKELGPHIDLQWILTTNMLESFDRAGGLQVIAKRSNGEAWITKALSLVQDSSQAFAIAQGLLSMWQATDQVSPSQFARTVACITDLWNRSPQASRQALIAERFQSILAGDGQRFSPNDLLLITVLAKSESGSDGLDDKLLPRVVRLARARMLDMTAPLQERQALVNLIGSGFGSEEDELSDARRMLSENEPSELKQTVIEALRRLRSTHVATSLIDSWDELNSPQRSSACATLLSRRDWTEALVVALEDGAIHTQELDPASIQRLRSYPNRALWSRCMVVFGKPTPRSEVVADYLRHVSQPQFTAASQKLFEVHCAACHQAQPGRVVAGPPLENLKHWTIDQWLTAILDPNRAVEPKYQQSQVLTEDDQIFSGIILEQTADHILLAQSDGTTREIASPDVAAVKQTQLSLMPEGFEEKLDPQQLSELLGYLRKR